MAQYGLVRTIMNPAQILTDASLVKVSPAKLDALLRQYKEKEQAAYWKIIEAGGDEAMSENISQTMQRLGTSHKAIQAYNSIHRSTEAIRHEIYRRYGTDYVPTSFMRKRNATENPVKFWVVDSDKGTKKGKDHATERAAVTACNKLNREARKEKYQVMGFGVENPKGGAVVVRRTFQALQHPKGSPERQRLNEVAETSEYNRSYKYAVRLPDGDSTAYVDKATAEYYAENYNINV